jgi:SHS2 domain-containing protein
MNFVRDYPIDKEVNLLRPQGGRTTLPLFFYFLKTRYNINMTNYQIIGTTADVKLKIEADSLEELFEQAALGMMEILEAEVNKDIEISRSQDIKIKSPNINSLLIDFLNEILYRVGVDKEIYQDFKVEIRDDKELTCQAKALPFKKIGLEIKAATYSNLKIEKDKDGKYKTEIVFDI